MTSSIRAIREIFSATVALIDNKRLDLLCQVLPEAPGKEENFPAWLAARREVLAIPAYLPELARLEAHAHHARQQQGQLGIRPPELCVNPTLGLEEVGWLHLPDLLRKGGAPKPKPTPGKDLVLIWLDPQSKELNLRSAASDELLALKIVIEGLDKQEVARGTGTSLAVLEHAIARAKAQGLLLAPPSALRRDPSLFAPGVAVPEELGAATVFTLQWHITQACDLHCRHCYDRSQRSLLTLGQARVVLDQLYDFCHARQVAGQVSFTGGNPLLHPQFLEIYQEAAGRGLATAILGNPTSLGMLARINAIQRPEFYQVSLEGLAAHNDFIRGTGHFERMMGFLAELKAAGIYSMVMLTLARNNLDQVLPLAEALRGQADLFTFNRLSMVGEGARLQTPQRQEYQEFLTTFVREARRDPVLAFKDNLINITLRQQGRAAFGGCTGFGCGAAFNFMALLADGEVHACRKFPSPIGNIHKQSLAAIYDSAAARRFRQGPAACRGCELRHVCGGCLAVIHSHGLDISRDRDPCCFMEDVKESPSAS